MGTISNRMRCKEISVQLSTAGKLNKFKLRFVGLFYYIGRFSRARE